MKRMILIAAVLLSLYGCSVYKVFKTPDVTTENICGNDFIMNDSTETIPVPSWQEMFPDTSLRLLIEKALGANTDLQIARLNIEQAEAALLASKLAYMPAFALSPEGSLTKSKGASAAYAYNLPLTMQWELDLSGKLRNKKEIARSAMLQSREYVGMVQTQLVASIANSYFTLLMLDEQLRITQKWAENQKENLRVVIGMKEAGMQSEIAVNQATSDYYAVQVAAKELTKQIRNVENVIALLVNETPQAIVRGSFAETNDIGTELVESISLTALSNRPDVKRAEYLLRESFYGVNLAKSAFYPSVSLGGNAGWINNVGGVISNPGSLLLSAIASLTQPIFNKGVNSANLKIAKLQYEQDRLAFQKALLTAGNEVNDALAMCQNSLEKKVLRMKQVEADELAYKNSMELMQHSSATYLDVLITQRMLLQSQLNQISDWFEGIQGRVSLYKALGGGID